MKGLVDIHVADVSEERPIRMRVNESEKVGVQRRRLAAAAGLVQAERLRKTIQNPAIRRSAEVILSAVHLEVEKSPTQVLGRHPRGVA
jgi:hypothetical protein